MRKATIGKYFAICVAAAAIAPLTLAAAPVMAGNGDGHGGGGNDKEVVLKVTGTDTSSFGNDRDPVPGTIFGFAGTNVLTETNAPFGTFGAVCTFVANTDTGETTQCQETLETPYGQITLQGIKTEPHGTPGDFREAVTGGTGSFSRASGWAEFHNDTGSGIAITLHLYGVEKCW
ncbi:hypothetical protein [Streptomyces sp. NPDC086787]|uniref:hypothetical protein n=1 Tax=Streptomyces sp. NPDC086787 TaxID=3365759 RepID=UPI00380BF1E3